MTRRKWERGSERREDSAVAERGGSGGTMSVRLSEGAIAVSGPRAAPSTGTGRGNAFGTPWARFGLWGGCEGCVRPGDEGSGRVAGTRCRPRP